VAIRSISAITEDKSASGSTPKRAARIRSRTLCLDTSPEHCGHRQPSGMASQLLKRRQQHNRSHPVVCIHTERAEILNDKPFGTTDLQNSFFLPNPHRATDQPRDPSSIRRGHSPAFVPSFVERVACRVGLRGFRSVEVGEVVLGGWMVRMGRRELKNRPSKPV